MSIAWPAPFVIVLGGGTASGKTTVATAFSASNTCLRISHDRYYRDVAQPVGHDYDHPDSLDTALLVEHVRALRAGQAAELPIYHFATHTRQSNTERVEPASIVLVEGILVLHHPELRALADLTAYVHAPSDLRLVRRLRRDVVERGRDVDGVLDQYLATVRPGHEGFVEPSRAGVDLELDGTAPIPQLLGELEAAVRRRRPGLL